MPTVYGVSLSPFVRKVRVCLAEKGIAYDLSPVIPGPNAPEEFKSISPLGKIPAFRDGERSLADSSVICAYLDRVHPTPPLYPSDPYAWARALWFEEYGDSGLAPVFGAKIYFQRVIGPRFFNQPTDEAVLAQGIAELARLFDYLEGQVSGRQFLVGGGLTIADIGVATQFANLAHAQVSVDASRWPALAAYVGRILARPSFAALRTEEAALFGS